MTHKYIKRLGWIFLRTSLLVTLITLPSSVWAITFCRCIEPGTADYELGKAQSVFSGKVKDIKWYGGNYDRVVFAVDKSWKGLETEEITVFTEHPSLVEQILGRVVNCTYIFTEGEEYLVYTYRDKASPDKVSGCGRTKRLDEAKADIDVLGKAKIEFER